MTKRMIEYWYTGIYKKGDRLRLKANIMTQTDNLIAVRTQRKIFVQGTKVEVERQLAGGIGGGKFGGYELTVIETNERLVFVPEYILEFDDG